LKTVKKEEAMDVSRFCLQAIGSQSVSRPIVEAVDRFFEAMSPGVVTTNAKLVEYLEAEGMTITNSIKTDVAMAAVVASNAWNKGNGSIERVKVNPDNKWSQWVYKKL